MKSIQEFDKDFAAKYTIKRIITQQPKERKMLVQSKENNKLY